MGAWLSVYLRTTTKKAMCSQEIGFVFKLLLTILGSIIDTIGKGDHNIIHIHNIVM